MFLSSYTNTSGSLGEGEMLWEQEPQVSVSTGFSSSPQTFTSVCYNSIETRSTCFLFLSENNATRKGKQLVNFDYQNVNSLCSPSSLRQQPVLVLCLHRVIQARFLTNQWRMCFLRTVF